LPGQLVAGLICKDRKAQGLKKVLVAGELLFRVGVPPQAIGGWPFLWRATNGFEKAIKTKTQARAGNLFLCKACVSCSCS
jgi:hypothetical protein